MTSSQQPIFTHVGRAVIGQGSIDVKRIEKVIEDNQSPWRDYRIQCGQTIECRRIEIAVDVNDDLALRMVGSHEGSQRLLKPTDDKAHPWVSDFRDLSIGVESALALA